MVMRGVGRFLPLLALLALAGGAFPVSLQGQAVVRAILFFSPTCPHCHQVINEDLPVIFDRFGGPPRVLVNESVPDSERAFYYLTNGQLEILLIDASRPAGGELYDSVTQQFALPRERWGVPRLVIGDSILVGSLEIPTQYPELIRQALDSGGIDWPDIAGLPERISALPIPEATASRPVGDTQVPGTSRDTNTAEAQSGEDLPGEALTDVPALTPSGDSAVDSVPTPSRAVPSALDAIPTEPGSAWERFSRDPFANGVSVVVLLVMILSVYHVFARTFTWQASQAASAFVPVLCSIGLVVAGYLSYVELSDATAVCGPVGDCNAVQQSPYSRLFGVPLSLLGVGGYVGIMVMWLLGRGRARIARWGTIAQFAMAFIGVVLSSYLTFLEPFVIGATCAWCLTSAVIMTALLWLTAGPAFRALGSQRRS